MAITDLSLSFTPIAGGTFPDGYADRMQGGLHVAATTSARNAIPDYRREEGMECYVIANTTKYRLKASPWAGTDADWEAVASGVALLVYNFPLANHSTQLVDSTPESIGMVRFDPVLYDPPGKTRVVTLEVVLDTSDTSYDAKFDILDVNGVTNGNVPIVLAGSAASTSSTTPTFISQVIAALSSVGACLLEGRLSVESPGPAFATCRAARLVVTWV